MKILIWHIHGSYLDAITSAEHDFFLPVVPDRYGGRRLSSPPWVHDVPYDRVRDLDLDLIIYQSPVNLQQDQYELLTDEQRSRAGKIYLEHNVPRPHAVDTRHPAADDPSILLVHVTRYNRLMWDNGNCPTAVIEHSVAIDRAVAYDGSREAGITVINGIQYRPRIAGLDLFLAAREQVALDLCGIDTEQVGGLGDISYRFLPARMAEYRFLFSPIRYTSLPLAVIEAMTIGMPVIALATTELPTVIENGVSGYLSCELDELVERMRYLLAHRDEAQRLGANARRVAEQRFGLERFIRDWNASFQQALALR